MPTDELGRRVHNDVGAQLQRALEQRRRERVVDDDPRARPAWRRADRGEVSDVEQRV